jgi:hypothetical protein
MSGNCQASMNPVMYQGFDPNMEYGPMPQMKSNDPRYLDLLQKYNTLLKMYRSRPFVKQVRQEFPRDVGIDYRLPVMQQQYPQTLKNLEQYANRLNLQFNPGDLTNTTEFMRENSLGKSTEDQYYELKRELGMGGSNRKKSKKIKRKKTAMGGKSKRKGKKSNYTKKRK